MDDEVEVHGVERDREEEAVHVDGAARRVAAHEHVHAVAVADGQRLVLENHEVPVRDVAGAGAGVVGVVVVVGARVVGADVVGADVKMDYECSQ